MDRTQQAEIAKSFLARHRAPPVLLFPNAWDAMSARLFVAAGFDALAITSGGVAWALGYPDGEQAPWPEVVAATARIVRAAQARASAPTLVTMSTIQKLATELDATGRFNMLTAALSHPDAQKLFQTKV